MRRIKLKAGHAGQADEWTENYTEGEKWFPVGFTDADAEKIGRGLIDFFNSTLRAHDRPRRYIGIEIVDDPNEEDEPEEDDKDTEDDEEGDTDETDGGTA